MGDTNEEIQESPSGFFTAMAGENAENLFEDATSHLKRYIRYLNRAIIIQKKRTIDCEWEVLGSSNYKLQPNHLFKIIPETKIQIIGLDSGWFEIEYVKDDEDDVFNIENFNPYYNLVIQWGKGDKQQIKELRKDDIRNHNGGKIEIHIPELCNHDHAKISWQGCTFRCYELNSSSIENITINESAVEVKQQLGTNEYSITGNYSESDELCISGTHYDFKINVSFDELTFKAKYPQAVKINGEWYCSLRHDESIQQPCCHISDITDEALSNLRLSELKSSNKDYIFNDGEWSYNSEKRELIHELNTMKFPDRIELTEGNYNWKLTAKKEMKNNMIQLKPSDNPVYDNDDGSGKSPLDYFFEENARIYPSEPKKGCKILPYIVQKQRKEEHQLMLVDPINNEPCQPEGKYLYLKPNYAELVNQKISLENLLYKPFPENLPLLELTKKRDEKNWEIFSPDSTDSIKWKVLTNLSFDGCDEQQKFVCTALATPDFAILNGPPGTGKTTTIIELIYQLLNRGKRILLAASTNAAINNILERLNEINDNPEEIKIFATRLGREERADGLEHFVLDNQCSRYMDKLKLEEETCKYLLVAASNLVCGTTAAIHTLFNRNNDSKDLNEDLVYKLTKGGAPFDVLIIDECSKTTFQEFAVPARLAKKWILVGDIFQLSPYTDRTLIETNIDKIHEMPISRQRACYWLYLMSQKKYTDEKLIIPVSKAEMKEIATEYDERISSDDTLKSNIFYINKSNLISENASILYKYNVLFIEISIYEEYKSWMPKDAIIIDDTWLSSRHAFCHFSNNKWNKHTIKNKQYDKTIIDSEKYYNEITKEMKKTWSEEIAWRLEREYWSRLSQRNRGKMSKREGKSEPMYQKLLPVNESDKVKDKINVIKSMAFPSILESLSRNGQFMGNIIQDTLSKGFRKEEKDCRLVSLTFQHRMRPDISKTPSKIIYDKVGEGYKLLDGSSVKNKPMWSYTEFKKYPSHAIWLDCNGQVKKVNGRSPSNEKEVQMIIDEVKSFCDYYEQHPKYDKEKKLIENTIAILTPYTGQETQLRDKLQKLTEQKKSSNFSYKKCKIRLATVDYIQGQEADIVYLSMVNTDKDGFIDSPNRLNVAITRARNQMVIVGKYDYYLHAKSEELRNLAKDYICIRNSKVLKNE